MWADSRSSPSAWIGEKNPIDPQRDAGVPERDLRARDRHAARAQHPQRAQVQRLGGRHEDQGPDPYH